MYVNCARTGTTNQWFIHEGKEMETHNHSVERNQDAALCPVRLGVGRDIVYEKARANEDSNFEQICASFTLVRGRERYS